MAPRGKEQTACELLHRHGKIPELHGSLGTSRHTYVLDGDEGDSDGLGHNNEVAVGDWFDSDESESAEERNQNDDLFKMAEGLWES